MRALRCYAGGVTRPWLGLVALVLAGCAAILPPVEQRSTQGPTARQMWTYRMLAQMGREPTFDERAHWETQLDVQTSRYLAAHPEAANALDVSQFRYAHQVTVGMDKEQVLILLGPPEGTTTDQALIEKLARRFWPALRGNVTEAWVYPLGWSMYFAGQRLVDITQYLSPRE